MAASYELTPVLEKSSKDTGGEPHPSERVLTYYNGRQSLIFGIIQLVCAVITLILNAVGIALHFQTNTDVDSSRYQDEGGYLWVDTFAYYIGTGVWCNVVVGISGGLAIYAGIKKTYCIVIFNMVMAIIAAAFSFLMEGMACWCLGHDIDRLAQGLIYQATRGYGQNTYTIDVAETSMFPPAKKSLAISVLFVSVSLVELIACVLNATLCCRVTCFQDSETRAKSEVSRVLIVDSAGQPMPDARLIQSSENTDKQKDNEA